MSVFSWVAKLFTVSKKSDLQVQAGIKQLLGPWTLATADAAYDLIVASGAGSARAKGILDGLKKSAPLETQKQLAAVAKLVAAGLPHPSVVARRKAQRQPLKQASDQSLLMHTIQRQAAQLKQLYAQRAKQQQMLAAEREARRERAAKLVPPPEAPAEEVEVPGLTAPEPEPAAEEASEREDFDPGTNPLSPPPGKDFLEASAPGDVEFSHEGG